MNYPEHNNHPNIEVNKEGNFIVIKWTDSSIDLNQIIANKIKDSDWLIRRNDEKEEFLKAFIGEKTGVFTLWLSIAKKTEHNLLYFSLPDQERKKIKVAGVINKGENYFTISAYSLYGKMILDRQDAINWLSENLSSLT